MRQYRSVVLFTILLQGLNPFVHRVTATWKASPGLVESLSQKNTQFNYQEEKIPAYTLPDPLVSIDGTRVTTPDLWQNKRRAEILDLFRTHVYGQNPVEKPEGMHCVVFDDHKQALKGLARRKQVRVHLTSKKNGPSMELLLYLPAATKSPVPTFLLLNFNGNHTILLDEAIKRPERWKPNPHARSQKKAAADLPRGYSQSRFPVEMILQRGYGLATIYYGDIDPDWHDGFDNGVQGTFDKHGDGKRPPDAWGSIGAWAWGLSRAMDYFETDSDIDHRRIAVLGHSRLGKTALWAGAQDERFALVISNNSGCGGAALSRRSYGETVARINQVFPHWFCENFNQYNDREENLPVDQHMLIALMAPRPVYVASADADLWADPRGEFLSCVHANPVYELLGLTGLETSAMPNLDEPINKGKIGYHIRSGKHNLTTYDWQQYLDFADRHLSISEE